MSAVGESGPVRAVGVHHVEPGVVETVFVGAAEDDLLPVRRPGGIAEHVHELRHHADVEEPPHLDMFTIRGDADGRLTLAC